MKLGASNSEVCFVLLLGKKKIVFLVFPRSSPALFKKGKADGPALQGLYTINALKILPVA